MSDMMHPRLRARQEQVERAHALAAERELITAINDVERLAVRLDDIVGTRMASSVHDTCQSLRQSLADNPPFTPAGRLVRRFVPDRVRDLTNDCRSTARALGGSL